jgi:plasmid rolling circle replication initiator protein Rep
MKGRLMLSQPCQLSKNENLTNINDTNKLNSERYECEIAIDKTIPKNNQRKTAPPTINHKLRERFRGVIRSTDHCCDLKYRKPVKAPINAQNKILITIIASGFPLLFYFAA